MKHIVKLWLRYKTDSDTRETFLLEVDDPMGLGLSVVKATIEQLWQSWLDGSSELFVDYFNRNSEPFTVREVEFIDVFGDA